eukprot:10653601-Prorocentrum_lima.AAC.1
MTSSLVGSEMCIRDRSNSAREKGISAPHLRTPQPITADGRMSLEHRRHPVSYTHLTLPTICSV